MSANMPVSFSLSKAKQLGNKGKNDDEGQDGADKVKADDNSQKKSILGDEVSDAELHENVFVPTGSKRHYAGRQKSTKSGPGTLAPDPMGGFSRYGLSSQPTAAGASLPGSAKGDGLKNEENVFSQKIAKASNLPPEIETREVEELFAKYRSLKVVSIEKIATQGASEAGRPNVTMKVTFDKNADNQEFLKALGDLNDKKYLGCGYYLHLDRYYGGQKIQLIEKEKMPFGARWEPKEPVKGFAPPPDLGGTRRDQPHEQNWQKVVRVSRPPDLETTRLIHFTVEGVIKGGVEFEAAIMNDPKIQKDERFAWLFEPRHPLNKYYRMRLYELVTGNHGGGEIYEGLGIWKYADDDEHLKDEFSYELSALSLGEDGPESDEEEEKPQRNFNPDDNYPARDNSGHGIMTPYDRTFLMYLLRSFPEANDKVLTKGEVAAVSEFAMDHATKGMGEVIDILISNVFQPFVLSPDNNNQGRIDLQLATMNALYLVSDVLMVSAKEPGAAYKYREAIGIQLHERKVFEYLENLPAKLESGRVSRAQYREKVNAVLALWKEEHTFDNEIMKGMDDAFNERERQKEETEKKRKIAEKRKKKGIVPTKASATAMDGANDEESDMASLVSDGSDDVSDQEQDDTDNDDEVHTNEDMPQDIKSGDSKVSELKIDESKVDGSKSGDSKVGQLKVDTSKSGDSKPGDSREDQPKETPVPEAKEQETVAARARRLRPKAEDMFALDEE